MTRVAIILDEFGEFSSIVTDSLDVEVYRIDDNAPDDRVYKFSVIVQRKSVDELSALLGSEINSIETKPNANQAIAAVLQTKPNGKPNIRLVEGNHD